MAKRTGTHEMYLGDKVDQIGHKGRLCKQSQKQVMIGDRSLLGKIMNLSYRC